MILYDIGVFNGDSALHFAAYPEIDRIEAYDPNPNFKSLWRAISKHYPNITFHNQAVSDRNGVIEYNLMPRERPLGSSTNKHKQDYQSGEKHVVECVDIADLINETCWVKVDAEGEEFNILERLIDTNKLRHIERIYLEWHTSKLKNATDYKRRQSLILGSLWEHNVEVMSW